MVGTQISNQLHCVLMMLLIAEIDLPREPDAIAGITPSGELAYNQRYSQGEIDELAGEYHGLIEQEKLNGMHEMNHLLGSGGVVEKDLLRGRNVILVSDGLKTGFPLDMAAEYLKPIALEKLIVATPLASVQAVDRMHVVADEIYCLSVIEDYMDTDHYYDMQDVPGHDQAISDVELSILQWQ